MEDPIVPVAKFDDIKKLVIKRRSPPLVDIHGFRLKDARSAYLLLKRMKRHESWNVPDLYRVEQAEILDRLLFVIFEVTLPRLRLFPEPEPDSEIDLGINYVPADDDDRYNPAVVLREQAVKARAQAGKVGGAVVQEIECVVALAMKVEVCYMDCISFAPFLPEIATEISRLRDGIICFYDPPPSTAQEKEFGESPPPPSLPTPSPSPSPPASPEG